jgi:hypothetical protein
LRGSGLSQLPSARVPEKISSDGRRSRSRGKDSRELFYLNGENWVVAVDIRLNNTVEVGVPTRLFQPHLEESAFYWVGNQYSMMPDGRFLVNNACVRLPDVVVNCPNELGR